MVTAEFAFAGRERRIVLGRILSRRYRRPQGVSPELQHLLSRMLCFDARRRCSLDELMRHPWMSMDSDVVESDEEDSMDISAPHEREELLEKEVKEAAPKELKDVQTSSHGRATDTRSCAAVSDVTSGWRSLGQLLRLTLN